MLLAGIGDVPDTVADRSIPIEMQRKRPDERVKGLRADDGRELWDLGRKSTRWVADNLDGLRRARPPTPGQLHDRAADAWSPLLAIADTAGGDWPERARRASLTLARDGADGAETALTRLLADIKAAFDAKATDRLASEDIIAYLVGLDDRPWPEFRAGKPITKAQLARLLRPLRILSGTIRLGDGRTPKGYYRRVFEDAFARYRPPEQNATTPQTRDSAGCSENQTATNGDGVAFGNREKPEDAADCGGVADRAGEDALCDFLERAGILEYDGGFSRADAERLAWAEIAARPPPMN
jgi:hypothetical protein